ncbi:tripartite tricarboxylate transporter substrate binding protein [Orrella sp. NBD-18]|uniref:Tripartite tricarboxylate transporter substrate binding protein n=1 Tax=Sheuella amnicola TaxID=2707330 RepID=A0A6B2QX34_9BURK|nr:tripartite tricarboxylate transporter substrate binding protein [Sheuella amnicola]NDY81824.1 tripartite tricarboxylate transporter substrate binding protein [Sheuella amnicola]
MKTVSRREFLIGATASLMTSPAFAQLIGSKTVKIVVPFSAGGPTDFIARQFAIPFAKELGMPVIIENRPGASGNIGTQQVVDSEPDGMTLVHSTAAMQAVNPLMYPNAKFVPSRDLVPVGITGALPNVLVVHPKSGIKTIDELIAKGKQPGARLTYATFGPGSSPHIYSALLRKASGISAESVPYKGSAHAITDMLAGHIDFMFDSMTTSVNYIKSGSLTGLAITSSQRSELLPNVPTLKESGLGGLDLNFWFALQAPVKTSPDVIAKLKKACDAAVQDPTYLDGMKARGVEKFYVPSNEIVSFVNNDTQKWTQAAQAIGIKPE